MEPILNIPDVASVAHCRARKHLVRLSRSSRVSHEWINFVRAIDFQSQMFSLGLDQRRNQCS
jgi:hypothetical protein